MTLVLDRETKSLILRTCVVLPNPGLLLKVNDVQILKECALCHLFETAFGPFERVFPRYWISRCLAVRRVVPGEPVTARRQAGSSPPVAAEAAGLDS